MHIPSLDAELALIDRGGLAGNGAREPAVQGLKKKIASASAIGAGCQRIPVIHYLSSYINPVYFLGAGPIMLKGDVSFLFIPDVNPNSSFMILDVFLYKSLRGMPDGQASSQSPQSMHRSAICMALVRWNTGISTGRSPLETRSSHSRLHSLQKHMGQISLHP